MAVLFVMLFRVKMEQLLVEAIKVMDVLDVFPPDLLLLEELVILLVQLDSILVIYYLPEL